MNDAISMCEIWRGEFLESQHYGHAVICEADGSIRKSWGNPAEIVLPRSSSKMIQALPLVESGAADAADLQQHHLALACASHQGARIHVEPVRAWLDALGKDDHDLLCGPEVPRDHTERDTLIRAGQNACQYHNNCSGKHAGFLTLNRHLGAEANYIDPDHPVQRACLDAFEGVTGVSSPGFGIDGCSAPNFATTLHGMARAMAFFAAARDGAGRRASAAARLRDAMIAFPELVAGEGRACSELMRATGGKAALKTGAEAFFVAILPEQKLGVALKITDGSTRGAECAIAAILVELGVLDAAHPATLRRMNAPILNRRGVNTGAIRPGAAFH